MLAAMGVTVTCKDYALLSAVRRFGAVPGTKGIQKIIYFVHEKTRMYVYSWRNWGPFSPEVEHLVECAIDNGEVALESRPSGDHIVLADKGRIILDRFEKSGDPEAGAVGGAIEFAYDLLAGKTAVQMELVASVHRIRSDSPSAGARDIWGTLHLIRPEAGFAESDVAGALAELQSKGAVR